MLCAAASKIKSDARPQATFAPVSKNCFYMSPVVKTLNSHSSH